MVKNGFWDTIAILYTWNLFVLYFGGRTLQKKAKKPPIKTMSYSTFVLLIITFVACPMWNFTLW